MSRPKRGDEFTHHKMIDQEWKPNRDQVWSQAPKARMKVTEVRGGTVFYTYADGNRGAFKMAQTEFLTEYGDELRPNLTVIDGGGRGHDATRETATLIRNLTDTMERLRKERG